MNDLQDRKRIRCKCGLVQFVSAKKACVRCHQPYPSMEPEPIAPQIAPKAQVFQENKPKTQNFEFWTAFVLWDTRQSKGMSQALLANKMRVNRTYVSRIENLDGTPRVKSLQAFCRAMETSPAFVVRRVEFLVSGK